MSAYGSPSTRAGNTADNAKRERTLSMIAGLLGILMFVWGFLRWLSVGDGSDQRKFSGYALEMPTTAIIGLSLAAGLIAALAANERRLHRGGANAVTLGLAATSFLLAIGVLLGKGAISPDVGSKVGVEIGLILAVITAALQTIVLAIGYAGRRDEHDHDHDHVDPAAGGHRGL